MNEKLLNKDLPYLVADVNLADWGRKEIEVSEHEMPGLMALRKKYGDTNPLKGAKIMGSLHKTIQTAAATSILLRIMLPRPSPKQVPRCLHGKGRPLRTIGGAPSVPLPSLTAQVRT